MFTPHNTYRCIHRSRFPRIFYVTVIFICNDNNSITFVTFRTEHRGRPGLRLGAGRWRKTLVSASTAKAGGSSIILPSPVSTKVWEWELAHTKRHITRQIAWKLIFLKVGEKEMAYFLLEKLQLQSQLRWVTGASNMTATLSELNLDFCKKKKTYYLCKLYMSAGYIEITNYNMLLYLIVISTILNLSSNPLYSSSDSGLKLHLHFLASQHLLQLTHSRLYFCTLWSHSFLTD